MAQAALVELAKAIDGLFELGTDACSDGDAIIELHRLRNRVDAYLTGAVGAFDDAGGWVASGATTATAWVTHHCHLPRRQAATQVSRARHLAHLGTLRGAYEGGEVTTAHVDAVVRFDRAPTDEVLKRDESLLVDQARTLSFADFARALAYWDQFADPDGTEERAEKQRTKRDVTLTESAFGTWLGTITLDPISGTIVADELDRLEETLFKADWADAKERLGRDPLPHQLARTPAQRRADALVEMATRSKMASATGRRPTPLVNVVVDYPTLAGRVCELANGTVVTPGSLVPYLDASLIERAVFGPDGRVEIGQATRIFAGATRRAIEIRDRVCQHPLCEQPVERCQVDHIRPASEEGPTTQANGRLLCPFHNRLAWRNHVAGRPWEAGPEAGPPNEVLHDGGSRPPPEPDG